MSALRACDRVLDVPCYDALAARVRSRTEAFFSGERRSDVPLAPKGASVTEANKLLPS